MGGRGYMRHFESEYKGLEFCRDAYLARYAAHCYSSAF